MASDLLSHARAQCRPSNHPNRAIIHYNVSIRLVAGTYTTTTCQLDTHYTRDRTNKRVVLYVQRLELAGQYI